MSVKRYFKENPMKISLLTVGTEVLIGHTIDTNAAFIGTELSKINLFLSYHITIGDIKEIIKEVFLELREKSDMIIITGGLGPTPDDFTKYAVAEAIKKKLVFNEELYKNTQNFFKKRNRKMPKSNKTQGEIIEGCTVIKNPEGTAPSLIFNDEHRTIILLPGVPREVKSLWENGVSDYIKKKFSIKEKKYNRIINCARQPESELSNIYEERSTGCNNIAFLPKLGTLEVRLTSNNKKWILSQSKILCSLLEDKFIGFDEDNLYNFIHRKLIERKESLSIAESCTGGLLGGRITELKGSSSYFKGGIIAYSNDAKRKLLKVSDKLLEKYGAVSVEVAEEMAKSCMKKFNSDYALAITGIAGPDGGSSDKPVGTVCIAIACADMKTISERHFFKGSRAVIRELAIVYSLDLLRKKLCSKARYKE
ncbi:MAG: competence/damage-inducible protein A [Candidatus Coatesbacteria bacterium]|nr:competence/damage-inducible protein A [Candidatus Coatesbacteria bacterium]